MAGEAVVGALRVVLGLDTVQLEDGIQKAGGLFEKFAGNIGKTLGVAAVAAGFAVVIESILHTTDALDKMGKTAQKVGVTVEEFSALKYAANLADVETGALATSMEKLGKNLSAAATGAGGPAADAFRALGIGVRDSSGHLKDQVTILSEIADKFASFRDGASKTALAIALFGRSGAEIIPLLNEGADGLKKSTEEAKQFGLVVSSDAAKAAQDFNDNLKRLSSVMSGILIQSTSSLVGLMADLSEKMVEAAKSSDALNTASYVASGTFKVLQGVFDVVSLSLTGFINLLKLLADVAGAILTTNFAGVKTAIDNYAAATAVATMNTSDAIKQLLGLSNAAKEGAPQFAAMALGMQKIAEVKPDAPILATKNALDHFIDSTKKSIAAMQAEFDTFGAAAGAREKAKFLLEAEAVAKANDITLTGQQKKAVDDLAASLEIMNQKLAGQQIVQELLTPWQLYQQQLAQIGVLLQSNAISLDTYARKSQLLALGMEQAYATAMQGIVSNVSSAFRDLAAINKSYAVAAKAAAVGEAIVNTYVAANKALATVPPPFDIAAAAAVVAAGLANVAKIVATPFATGGSFKVGGAGGIDSQMVAIAATPGETVDVRRPDQQDGFGTEITLRGVGPDDLYTGKMLRSLFNALNQGQRDGYKLIVAER